MKLDKRHQPEKAVSKDAARPLTLTFPILVEPCGDNGAVGVLMPARWTP